MPLRMPEPVDLMMTVCELRILLFGLDNALLDLVVIDNQWNFTEVCNQLERSLKGQKGTQQRDDS
jgi:hypothetical protein